MNVWARFQRQLKLHGSCDRVFLSGLLSSIGTCCKHTCVNSWVSFNKLFAFGEASMG